MKGKKKVIIVLLIIMILLVILGVSVYFVVKPLIGSKSTNINALKIDLNSLTYEDGESIKTYTLDDFDIFLSDYNNKSLDDVYVTEFLFDGVSTYKAYDLDDFIENGNDYEVDVVKLNVVNINTSSVEFTGEIKGGMLAVNTNDLDNDVTIYLNNVNIDTDSKKIPAIYVYNKDITYVEHKVVISAVSGSTNYIEGGKLKKVSLVPSDDLSSYSKYYTGDNDTNYSNYSDYYGIYTKEQINNILFATVQADSEDLKDADPYYFYKASGAISSDIDLYFEGEGYLEVTSKNKEGIETKGNLTFSGGKGDYVVNAEDDCLNTTTSKSENANARNTITIDVNSLYAIVSLSADEGDAIDSNGTLIINSGNIVALAKPGSDAGVDSENGTYINGGTLLAIGDMLDEISSDSKQTFIVLSFSNKLTENDNISFIDSNDNNVFTFKTDRTFSYLVYSSPILENGDYTLYKNGTIEGEEKYGFYTNVTSYEKGSILGYSSTGSMNGGMRSNMFDENMTQRDRNETNSEMNGEREMREMPSNDNMQEGERPEMPSDGERPEMPSDGERPEMENGNIEMPNNEFSNIDSSSLNTIFSISSISNYFNGISIYSE